MTSITWNGREIHNPALRVLAALWAVTGGILAVAGVTIMVGVMMVTFPIWLPVDWLLKHYGRRGFAVREADKFSLEFTREAFRRG